MQSPDGRKIVKDLITHRNLWQVVLSDDSPKGRENFIKLRDMERYSFTSNLICIAIKKNKKEDFERLARKWNPTAIEFQPVKDQEELDLIAELYFE